MGLDGSHRFLEIKRGDISLGALLHFAKAHDMGVNFAKTGHGAKIVIFVKPDIQRNGRGVIEGEPELPNQDLGRHIVANAAQPLFAAHIEGRLPAVAHACHKSVFIVICGKALDDYCMLDGLDHSVEQNGLLK